MPELPEVETCVRGLSRPLCGRVIQSVIVRDRRLRWPIEANFDKRLLHRKITTVSRRAKYIVIGLDSGHLIIHLGMSGSVKVIDDGRQIIPHDHVDIILDSKQILRYNDPRRFGCMFYTAEPIANHRLFMKLGPEPFDPTFTSDYLLAKCSKRKAPIKNVLMDNQIVVGVGNIYANEALFLSNLHPNQPAYQLSKSQLNKLIQSVQTVLTQAIQQGGTTLKDFVNADGKPGYFQQSLSVYGREDQPCFNCKAKLRLIKLGGRASVFCPNCQRYP